MRSAPPSSVEERRRRRGRPLDDLADVDRLVPELHPAGLDLGQVERVVDERRQPLALLDDDPDVVAHLADGPVELRVVRLGSAGKMTSSSRFEMSSREADDRGQRRPQLVADVRQERALGAAVGGFGGGAVVADQGGRPLGDPAFEGGLLLLDLGVQPGVLDARGDEAADRVQQRSVAGSTSRPVRRLSTARTPIVRPLVTSGVPRNELTSSSAANVPVARVRVLVDVAEQERPVGAGDAGQLGRRAGRAGSSSSATVAAISGLPPIDRPSARTPRSSSRAGSGARSKRRWRVSVASDRSSSSSRSSVDPAATPSSLRVTSSATRCWRSRLASLGRP